ncbi:SoxR reducing system RseC family protein [Alkaliphilus transvaalensis]|uniref:SoxR reducing system RseC family protein n=1 Tax=Alkaliphilus transvaalensis TaxID=114628 RepID=UPI000478E4FC|nr:SoxR reducing system RseC family protein [Alkaliphilus transvaalensis]
MKQVGIVTSVEGKTAKVLMQRHSSCGDCHACKMGDENTKLEIKVLNEAQAKVGEWVTVDMRDQDVLTAAFMVYVIPLLTLLFGVISGNFILNAMGIENFKDIFSALFGFGAMAISFIFLKRREGNLKMDKRFLPVASSILDNESGCSH